MNIILGEHTIPIITSLGRTETIDGLQRSISEIWTDSPLTAEQIALFKDGWSIEDESGNQTIQHGYTEVIRYSTWVAQTDANVAVVLEKEAAIATLTEEKTTLVAEKEQVQTDLAQTKQAVRAIFTGRKDDLLVELLSLVEEWDANGTYEVGDVRKQNNIPYTAAQATTPNGDLNQSPALAPALWVNYHAQSAKYALPYVAPTHAEDMYKQNEYMIFDEKIYKCLVNTDRDPTVLPNNWQEVDVNGDPVEPVVEEPGEGEEPQVPVEKNSNGTDVWSEWVVWNNDPATLYKIGDRVTLDGVRYIATLDGNHWSPDSGTGWAVAPE